MANEATMVQQLQDRLPEFTVDANTTIAKGAILKLADNNTALIGSADGDFFAGIAAFEKSTANGDTSTKLSAYDNGVFMCNLSSSVSAGEPLKILGNNVLIAADDSTIENSLEVVGYALEDGTSGSRIEVRIGR